MELAKNPRFLDEYNNWNKQIQTITDTSKKQEMQRLLQQLVNNVKKIDQSQMNISQRLVSETISDSRQSILELRRKIHSKLKELHSAGVIS